MRVFVALFLFLASLPCFAQGGFLPGSQYGPAVQWTTIAQGYESRITRNETRFLSNQLDWDIYYRQMCGLNPNVRVYVPQICDWDSYDLLIVHTGQRQTPGYGVYVETIGRTSSEFHDIRIVVSAPNPQSRYSNYAVSPFVIIKVAKCHTKPRFFYRTITSSVIVLNNNVGCCCGCGCCAPGGISSSGEIPAWRVGPNNTLIPVNDAAKKMVEKGQTPKAGGSCICNGGGNRGIPVWRLGPNSTLIPLTPSAGGK